jgi:hypothetical protein
MALQLRARASQREEREEKKEEEARSLEPRIKYFGCPIGLGSFFESLLDIL